MIKDVDEVLRQLLTQELPNGAVDIKFSQPKSLPEAGKPAVNVFLYDLRENTTLRQPGWEIKRNGDGTATKRRTDFRVDLHYMITAWATDADVEHDLLTRTLMALLRHPHLPEDLLPENLQYQPVPIPVRLAQHDELRSLADIWSAVGDEWRPAISCVITLALNPYQTLTDPLVRTRDLRFGQKAEAPRRRPPTITDMRVPQGLRVGPAAEDGVQQRLDIDASQDRFWMVGGTVRGDRPLVSLFSVGLGLRSHLELGILSQSLRQEFEEHGISLSDNATVKTEEEGARWQIVDQGHTHVVIRDDEKLNIYRLAHVRITLLERGLEVPMQEDGQFIIGNLEEGEYTLEVSVEGREPSQYKIAVPAQDYDIEI